MLREDNDFVGRRGILQKKSNLKLGGKSAHGFRKKGNKTFFSVADFIRANELPDDPQFQRFVIEEVRQMYPRVRIVGEEN